MPPAESESGSALSPRHQFRTRPSPMSASGWLTTRPCNLIRSEKPKPKVFCGSHCQGSGGWAIKFLRELPLPSCQQRRFVQKWMHPFLPSLRCHLPGGALVRGDLACSPLRIPPPPSLPRRSQSGPLCPADALQQRFSLRSASLCYAKTFVVAPAEVERGSRLVGLK